MIRADQKTAAQKAGFHFITALTKPQIQKMLDDKVFETELFDEKVHEVLDEEGRRFVLRRNPVRQEELKKAREQKRQSVQACLDGYPESQHLLEPKFGSWMRHG